MSLVDWGLAERVGRAVAGSSGAAGLPAGGDAVCELALDRVLAYSGLQPAAAVPAVEAVTRDEWVAANVSEMSELAAPLERRAAAEVSLPWPIGGIVRGALGAAGAIEVGVLMGYASRRVLGQYQVALTAEPREPRLLLIRQNLDAAATELDVDRARFLLWVAMHEQTHSVQFAAVPWLREHLAGLVERLIDTAAADVDLDALVALARRLISTDPRRTLRDALRGELARTLAGPAQAAVLDQLQAAMAVIEGYAEHVMDAAAQADDDLALMRDLVDARRARPAGLADVIARALGLGMKLRQYELGRAWADAVAAEAGIAGVNRVWSAPEALPTLGELEDPSVWLRRVAPTAVA